MDKFIDVSKVKIFELKDLNGKTLEITVFESEKDILVTGRDTTTKDVYTLYHQPKTQEKPHA